MSVNFSSNIHSASVNGQLGLSRASNNISQNALNIAQLSTESQQVQKASQNFLADAMKPSLPTSKGNINSELVDLTINSTHAQASIKVIDKANESVGTILDILA